MVNSTTKRVIHKPPKPYHDFPLFAHSNGKWAKKIRGRLHYFGRWESPDKALEDYKRQSDALHKGSTPRPHPANSRLKTSVIHS